MANFDFTSYGQPDNINDISGAITPLDLQLSYLQQPVATPTVVDTKREKLLNRQAIKESKFNKDNLLTTANKSQFYDADTIYQPGQYSDGIRLGAPDSSKALYINAPEKKFSGRTPTPEEAARYNASRMALDNFAMGTTPASIQSYQDLIANPLTPENQAIYDAEMAKLTGDQLAITGTPGQVGVHGRQVAQAYNLSAPNPNESLENRLFATGNADYYSYGKPINVTTGTDDSLTTGLGINVDGTQSGDYFSNLVDNAQYGIGRKIAGVADAAVDAATRGVLEAQKKYYGWTEEEAINNLVKNASLFKRDPKTGDFIGFDEYKTAEYYGYDDSRTQNAMKEIGEAKGVLNTFLAIAKNADAAPNLFLDSSGELLMGALKAPGLILNAFDYANQAMEDTMEAQGGKPLTNAQRAVDTLAGFGMAAVNKLGTDEMIGRTKFVKGLVGAASNKSKSAAINIAKALGKSALVVAGKAGYEGVEEIIQESMGILATKYNIGAEEIFDDKTIKELKQAFGGGVLGGGFPAAVGVAKDAVAPRADELVNDLKGKAQGLKDKANEVIGGAKSTKEAVTNIMTANPGLDASTVKSTLSTAIQDETSSYLNLDQDLEAEHTLSLIHI